jgi:hypothetical protein
MLHRLPEDVCFLEEPQVVRWDEHSKEWKTDGFTEITFKEGIYILPQQTVTVWQSSLLS